MSTLVLFASIALGINTLAYKLYTFFERLDWAIA